MKCPKCKNKMTFETKILEYTFYCSNCDENFYTFEGIEEYNGEKDKIYNRINNAQLIKIKKLIDSQLCDEMIKIEKYELIQSVPTRFREDAYDCIEYTHEWSALQKTWEYFLYEIIDELTYEEIQKYNLGMIE